MEEKELLKIGKLVSLILRHEPEQAGLTLEPGGWAKIDDLLRGLAALNMPITRPQLDALVAENNKQRYAYDESGTRIRASQGHSVAVDLQLDASQPPDILYHGTTDKEAKLIRDEGLKRMDRQTVHLSPDAATAEIVGKRKGKPLVLEINAGRMHREGYVFYRSDNGVWLTEFVPPEYIFSL